MNTTTQDKITAIQNILSGSSPDATDMLALREILKELLEVK